ncbi:MAG: SGNH/GDSL hydrolase family protein, partial [Proteobacteria bacterium]|nr:SGNH/GDSL hydrolase family protein [Pseudomonadota bacterium]
MPLPAYRNLLLTAASVMVALVAVEIGLRLVGVSYPEFHRLDDNRGWAPRPGVAGWWTDEGKAYVDNNAAGFRDRDHALAKP